MGGDAPDSFDVIVVGGGIAGSALARSLAHADLDVLVVERQEEFRDRVRGEAMMPWGVVEARRLGVEQLLLAAGGAFATRTISYDEIRAPAEAEEGALPLDIFAPDVPGFLDVGHPQACEALLSGAAAAGATVVRGVGEVVVAAGAQPAVRYELDGEEQAAQGRLVVGADGRMSTVRRQLGIELHETEPRTMLAGLLVSDLDEWPSDQISVGTADDVHFLLFPRPDGVVRLYLAYDIAQKARFAGADRADRFLDAFRIDSLPLGHAIASATPAGPCAGHANNDSWTEHPYVDGAVLIGDAAGWSDPLIGQGLSVALRDARTVAECLVGRDDWSAEAFVAYGDERAERMRRLRVTVSIMTDLRCDFTPRGRARRSAFFTDFMDDPLSVGVLLAQLSGPEVPEPEIFDTANVERILAMH
ncbi:MAG: NAD(P)/FAD-dependent oxidoreductase [Acidimicrobiales bacterium]